MTPSFLTLSNLSKSFGDTEVLHDVSLQAESGEFLALVGPSGCGKSTLLRIIAGLEPATSGAVAVAGRNLVGVPPKHRGVAMVFQNYALYPHMSVAMNLAMPLMMERLPFMARLPGLGQLVPGHVDARRAIASQVERVAEQLQITPLLQRKPSQLSGGQRQRVALGRAMMRSPNLFLLDEPLSNLDAQLRVQVRKELSELHKRLGATFVFVTHDQAEAMTMATRIAMMLDGRIVQVGTPDDLYDAPLDIKVARFIGSPAINEFAAETDSRGQVTIAGKPVPVVLPDEKGETICLGVRSEDVVLHSSEGSASPTAVRFPGRILDLENLGNEFLVRCTIDVGHQQDVVARVNSQAGKSLRALGLDGSIDVSFKLEKTFFFDGTGHRIDRCHLAANGTTKLSVGLA